MATERKTFLFVTHSIEEAVYVSDRIVILSRRPSQVSSIVEPDIGRGGDPERSGAIRPISIRSSRSGRASSAISIEGAP